MSKKIILSADQSCDLGPVLQEKFGVEYEDGYVCTDNIEVLKKIFEIED